MGGLPKINPHVPDSQGFIPGVFNYCDRWCEKCRFIRQCRVGCIEADEVVEENDDPASEQVEGKEDVFRRLMAMAPRARAGVDPDAEDEDDDAAAEEDDEDDEGFEIDPAALEITDEDMEEFDKKEEETSARVDAHELSMLSDAYMEFCDEWIESRDTLLKGKGIDLSRRPGQQWVALPPEMLVLQEAVEEVAWFRTMLPVKTDRCVRGKLEDPGFMERIGPDPQQSDENGTAKLVLHILDRCETAWQTIAELLPSEADAAVPILELLRRHRALIKAEFPDAMKFIRPGFDAPAR
jgi:hypothetical protein